MFIETHNTSKIISAHIDTDKVKTITKMPYFCKIVFDFSDEPFLMKSMFFENEADLDKFFDKLVEALPFFYKAVDKTNLVLINDSRLLLAFKNEENKLETMFDDGEMIQFDIYEEKRKHRKQHRR